MSQSTPPTEPLLRDPVEELAEVFLDRYRRGERPSLTEFIAQAPEHEEEIRELFPALVLMERADWPLPVADPSPIGAVGRERLGDYRIIREVGRGGMGIVYEAEQEPLGRRVALKVLPQSTPAGSSALLRFRREARSAARLHHTNIVPVFDVGEHEGIHFYAMQFIPGRGLDEIIAQLRRMRTPESAARYESLETIRIGPDVEAAELAECMLSGHFPEVDEPRGATTEINPHDPTVAAFPAPGKLHDSSVRSEARFYRSVARIGLQAAEALAYAHAQHVLHRDIKPANLLVDSHGTTWVTDFGLAKERGDDLTRTGDVVGTLRYMAPERLSGKSDGRSDVYGLGVTLYELLTLRPAFPQVDRAELVRAIVHQSPSPPRAIDPRMPRDLETIVNKATAKEPRDRYATAEDLAIDLRRYLADLPLRARRVAPWEHAARWCRRNPGWAATLATTLALLVIVAVGGAIFSFRLQRANDDLKIANQQEIEKLWLAHVERARALRSSGSVGQRFKALEAIRDAARIKITPELRNEAISALTLPDVEIAHRWTGCAEDTTHFAYDVTLERYARVNEHGEIVVCRRIDDREKGDREEIVAQFSTGANSPPKGLWISPGGQFAACAFLKGTKDAEEMIRIWRLDDGAPKVCRDVPKGMHLHAFAFHPDGRRLAIGHDDGTVSLFDLNTDVPAKRIKIGIAPNSLAFHPRIEQLAVACDDAIRIVDLPTETIIKTLRNRELHWSFGLAWHPNGKILAATTPARRIHLWDVERGIEARDPLEGHASAGIFMAFNHRGDCLISSDWDDQTHLWDLQSYRTILTVPGRIGMQFSADDSVLGMERKGTELRLWRFAPGHELRTVRLATNERNARLHNPVLCAEDAVLAAGSDRGLAFFNLEDGSLLAFAPFSNDNQTYPRHFNSTYGLMTSGAPGMGVWPAKRDADHPERLRIGPPRWLTTAAQAGADASTDGRICAIPQITRGLVVDRSQPGRRVYLQPHHDVRYCAVSPDGQLAATCGWSLNGGFAPIRIWNAATGKHVADLSSEGACWAKFSPDGKYLAAHSLGRGVKIWDVASWKSVKWIDAPASYWGIGGRELLVTDIPGGLRVLNASDFQERFRIILPYLKQYHPACITRDGARLVLTASDHAQLYVCDLRAIGEQLVAMGFDGTLLAGESTTVAQAIPPIRAVDIDTGVLRPDPIGGDASLLVELNARIEKQNSDADAFFQRALAHTRSKDYGKAVADFDAFLAQAAENDSRRGEASLRKAVLSLRRLNDRDVAIEALRAAMTTPEELIPWPGDYASLCNEAAWMSIDKPNRSLAERVLPLAQKCVALEPSNRAYQNTLGVVLYRVGNVEESLRCLTANSVDVHGDLAFDLYFIAMGQAKLGQRDDARKSLSRADKTVGTDTKWSAQDRLRAIAFHLEAEKAINQAAGKK